MKKLICIFLFFPLLCFSQSDSLRKHVISWQLAIPFEAGLSYYFPSGNNNSAFGHLLGNRKSIGTRIQVGSVQLQFYDRAFIEAAYNFDNTGWKSGAALAQLQKSNPGYFIQDESKYAQSTGEVHNSNNLKYFRLGGGVHLVLKPYHYLKPYLSYDIGTASLPQRMYAFKEYTSNNFIKTEYTYGHLKSRGFNAGVCYTYFPSPVKGKLTHAIINVVTANIKLEYSFLSVSGTGKITRTDLYSPAVASTVPVKDKFHYISLCISLAFGHSTDKQNVFPQ